MITFKQFISERESRVNAALKMIEYHCGPFLRESKRSGFLIRGIKGLSGLASKSVLDIDNEELEYAVKQVRGDRKPLDSTPIRHEFVDKWFKETVGFSARSEAVFAYGKHVDKGEVSPYGTPCIIFPIGEIKYVWSAKVQDLYSDIPGTIRSEESLRKWLDDQGYKTTGLEEAVQSKSEIMIKCESYFAFPLEYKDQLTKSLGF